MVSPTGPSQGRNFNTLDSWKNFARMEETKYERRIDSAGRILIPIRLREEVGLEVNSSCKFYKHVSDGKLFLCIECPDYDVQKEIEKAKQLLAMTNNN